MAMKLFILTLLSIYVHGTLEAPPKLNSCRQIFKARTDIAESVDYPITASCGTTVTFPLPTNVRVNATDPRNCDNYYSCTGATCLHCPCPDNEWFDPLTLRCSPQPSTCTCSDEPTTVIPTTRPTTTQTDTTPPPIVIEPDTSGSQSPSSGHTDTNNNGKPVSSMEIIIIAAIVSATVIIVVVIVMAVVLWQKRNKLRNQRESTPVKFTSQGNCATDSSAFTTYAPPSQPCERHIYAEIDENKAGTEIRTHWQHGGNVPPPPVHQPPAGSTFCPIHNCTDSGVGSTDTSLTSMCPRPIHIAAPSLIRYGGPFQPHSNEEFYKQSSSSTSSDYSQSSQQTSLDSHDIANLLPQNINSNNHNEPPKNQHQGSSVNYVSKHVYV